MYGLFSLGVALIWMWCALTSATIAARSGRSYRRWLLLGLSLGALALIPAARLRPIGDAR
jgi:hypothetical protein